MAEKEAIVYIVDVGKSMKQHNNGRDISDLDWAMRYVWDKITTTVSTAQYLSLSSHLIDCYWKVATGRKTATIGVVGLKTDGGESQTVCCNIVCWFSSKETKVPLEDDEGYENISVLQDIGQWEIYSRWNNCSSYSRLIGCWCRIYDDYARRSNPARQMKEMVCLASMKYILAFYWYNQQFLH